MFLSDRFLMVIFEGERKDDMDILKSRLYIFNKIGSVLFGGIFFGIFFQCYFFSYVLYELMLKLVCIFKRCVYGEERYFRKIQIRVLVEFVILGLLGDRGISIVWLRFEILFLSQYFWILLECKWIWKGL